MGLVVLAVLGAYLLFSIGVVAGAVQYARKRQWSKLRWGISAALVMWLIPFWDWIPTMVVHRYYCENEAGLWVYKTKEQWMRENPGAMDGLRYNQALPQVQTRYGMATAMNARFIYFYKYDGPLPLNRWRVEVEIRDVMNGEVIAREIDYSVSQERRQAGARGWKFWLIEDRCTIVSHRDQGSFDKVIAEFEGAK